MGNAPVNTRHRDADERSAKAVPSSRCLIYRGCWRILARTVRLHDIARPISGLPNWINVQSFSNKAAADGSQDVLLVRFDCPRPWGRTQASRQRSAVTRRKSNPVVHVAATGRYHGLQKIGIGDGILLQRL
jgi:hypothetical protein